MTRDSVKKVGRKVAQDLGKAEVGRVKDRIDGSTEEFKIEAAEKIEDLAEQIRDLGKNFEYVDEAGLIARRLEKTADYLRYRQTSDIGQDTLTMIKNSKAFWIAAGLMVGMIVYRTARKQTQSDL